MKRFIFRLLAISFIFNISVFAENISNTEIEQWKSIGVKGYQIRDWLRLGINTPKEAKQWVDSGFNYYYTQEWKLSGVNTPEEAKQWKKLKINGNSIEKVRKARINTPKEAKRWIDAGIEYYEIYYWKKYNINTPKEAKSWKDNKFDVNEANYWKNTLGVKSAVKAKQWKSIGVDGFDSFKRLKKANIKTYKEAKQWYDAGIDLYTIYLWKDANVNFPEEVKQWKSFKITANTIMDVKKANINIDELQQWKNIGVVGIRDIFSIMKNGFKSPNDYEPYKNVYLKHAIKLKEWNIVPDKLIESMSYSNNIFGQELYFTDKNTFEKAYDSIENNCDEIIKDKWFSAIDMSENEDKCYIFAGKMIQRLDEKSFFGKITKSGLVNGLTKRNFYVENFKGSWMENKTKIGVIKGNGSISYDSISGKKLVPKGTVIFLK